MPALTATPRYHHPVNRPKSTAILTKLADMLISIAAKPNLA
jgi:hypothetical protein